MKKFLIGILAIVLLASPFALLHAEDATTSSSSKSWRGGEQKDKDERGDRGGWRDKMMFGDRMEGLREKMQERRDEMRVRFDTKRAEVITDILNRLEERFQNAIDRMGKIAVRVQERIDLLKADGSSLDEAQGFLDDAKKGISDAQKALDAIDLTDAVVTTTPSTTLKSVREEFKVVKELLKSAYTKLSDAINSIKKGLSDDDNERNGVSDGNKDNKEDDND